MDDRADLVRRDLLKIIQQLKARIDNQAQNIAALATSATNQAAQIAAIAAKEQRVNQAITLVANVPQDVPVTWPNPWPDTGYGVIPTLTTGPAALGKVDATLKAGSKTTTGCVITVLSTVDVASAGLDVVGIRT